MAGRSSLKTSAKYFLSRLGLFNIVDLLRRLPAIACWIQTGCSGIAPPPIKRIVISAYLRRYGLTHFIESGTYLGDTLAYIAQNKDVHATSIELDEAHYRAAKIRFASYPNVTLLHGDSGNLLPELVRQLKEPALFWFDGHYSGGQTARGTQDTPIISELQAILDSPVKGHVILIDDARFFNGTHDYPHLYTVLKTVHLTNSYYIEISTDIIRLTPKR